MAKDFFDLDEFEKPSRQSGARNKKSAGTRSNKRKNDDLLLIGLLTLFFIVTTIGGFMYYNIYIKPAENTVVQNNATDEKPANESEVVIAEPKPAATPQASAATDDEKADDDLTDEERQQVEAMEEFLQRFENAELENPVTMASYPEPSIKVHTLVFLLDFNNQPLKSSSSTWSDYYFDNGYYGTGSVDQYFREATRGKMAILPAKETQGTKNDGIIKLDMGSHPRFNGEFLNDSSSMANTLFDYYTDVIKRSDKYIDYSKYDTDDNGYIESRELNVVFVFAGYEDAIAGGRIANATYSFQVDFTRMERSLKVDGVRVATAVFTSELDPSIDRDVPISPMGIICHEIGHSLALPDLYDTDYSSEGLAFHSLMASGSYNYYGGELGSLPPPLMAWSLVKLGVHLPVTVAKSGTYRLYARSSESYNIIKIPAANGYYLIENVDFEGYGQGIGMYAKAPGIAIWYIDGGVMNSLTYEYTRAANDNEFRPGVRLVEPFGGSELLDTDFDYYRVHDHYFRLSGDSNYTGAHGVIIDVLDDGGEVMEVKIKIND